MPEMMSFVTVTIYDEKNINVDLKMWQGTRFQNLFRGNTNKSVWNPLLNPPLFIDFWTLIPFCAQDNNHHHHLWFKLSTVKTLSENIKWKMPGVNREARWNFSIPFYPAGDMNHLFVPCIRTLYAAHLLG